MKTFEEIVNELAKKQSSLYKKDKKAYHEKYNEMANKFNNGN